MKVTMRRTSTIISLLALLAGSLVVLPPVPTAHAAAEYLSFGAAIPWDYKPDFMESGYSAEIQKSWDVLELSNGNWILAYRKLPSQTLYLWRSIDGGATFGTGVQAVGKDVNTVHLLEEAGVVYMFYTVDESSSTFPDWSLYVQKSTDFGTTWSAATLIGSGVGPQEDVAYANGRFYIVGTYGSGVTKAGYKRTKTSGADPLVASNWEGGTFTTFCSPSCDIGGVMPKLDIDVAPDGSVFAVGTDPSESGFNSFSIIRHLEAAGVPSEAETHTGENGDPYDVGIIADADGKLIVLHGQNASSGTDRLVPYLSTDSGATFTKGTILLTSNAELEIFKTPDGVYRVIFGPFSMAGVQQSYSTNGLTWQTAQTVYNNTLYSEPRSFQVTVASNDTVHVYKAGYHDSWEPGVGSFVDADPVHRVSGAVPALSTNPSACASGVVGKTVDMYDQGDGLLVGGSFGWKLIDGRGAGAGTVLANGGGPIYSVRLGDGQPNANTFIVGGPNGWNAYNMDLVSPDFHQLNSSSLAANVVDVDMWTGDLFAGGPNGWEVKQNTGGVVIQGTEKIYDGGFYHKALPSATELYIAGPWGWKRLDLSGTVVAQGGDATTSFRDVDGDEANKFTFGGSWGVKFTNETTGTLSTDPTVVRAVSRGASDGSTTQSILGTDSAIFALDNSTGAKTSLIAKAGIAVDLDNDTSGVGERFGLFAGDDGWGIVDLAGAGTASLKSPNASWAARVSELSRNYGMVGGSWGWSEVSTGTGSSYLDGSDPVDVCIPLISNIVGPPPPAPPGPPPTESFSELRRLSVYDGIIWIVGGAPNYNVMQIGNAGRDIVSDGRIYFTGNSVDAGTTYFEGAADAHAQKLSINAGNASFPAVQLHSINSPALEVRQDDPAGSAARFLGHVYVSGALKVLDDPAYPGAKSSAVQTPGGERKLYAVEAPDARFTDYGSAQLDHGTAYVKLDPTFAETLADRPYHVNLTAQDIPTTLSILRQDAAGFVVSGAQDVSFFYEISGIRKGFEDRRLP